MSRPPPPLNLVRSFEAAARHLSFTHAARELGLTQAAVSTHLRALETYIGRPLFIRRARSLVLTETGEAYLPTLRQALAQIDTATEAIVAGQRARSISLACPVSLAQTWLPGMLVAFREVWAGTEVQVQGTVWDTPEVSSADLVIAVYREAEAPPGYTPLWTERLVLLCTPQAARRIATPADLAMVPRIAIAGRQDYWPLMEDALGLPRAPTPIVLRSNATTVALEMAVRVLGAVICPESLGRLHVARGLLCEPFDARPVSPWQYWLRPPDPRAAAPVNALARLLQGTPP